ncbi:MAG TPA: nuclear transport factor 2 family protein [Terriglobales bacterium]
MYRPVASHVPSSASFPDVESTIRGLAQDLCTAFNTGNYDQMAAMFAADGSFMPPHHEAVYGPKAIEHLLREFGESGYDDLRFEMLRVEHSGDIAFEMGRFTVAIRQDNGTTVAERGKYLRGWRRLGAWLIIADCWNSNLPLAK